MDFDNRIVNKENLILQLQNKKDVISSRVLITLIKFIPDNDTKNYYLKDLQHLIDSLIEKEV
jgi:hypothetical protein